MDAMMKWWKMFSKNLKGFSLVELICTVAILSIVVTSAGSAMVISARSYQRGSTELDLQQQAQITANLLTNLIIDADKVEEPSTAEWGPLLSVIKVEKETVIDDEEVSVNYRYKVTTGNTSEGKPALIYTREKLDGTSSETNILAENITNFEIKRVAENSNNIDFKLEVTSTDGKTFKSDYHVTPRNGVSSSSSTSVISNWATIYAENSIVLEPGQTYELNVSVANSQVTDPAATPFELQNITGVTDTTGTTVSIKDRNTVEIHVGLSETDSFHFDLTATNATALPVNVLVRRVTGVDVSGEKQSGNHAEAGAVYNVTAQTTGTNLSKVLGAWYDIDYVPTYPVTWELQGEGLPAGKTVGEYAHMLEAFGDINNPSCKVELLQDIPQGASIKVIAVAKHPEGQIAGMNTNKSGVMYRGAAPIKGEYIIKKNVTAFERGKEASIPYQFNVGELGGFRADGFKNLYKAKNPGMEDWYYDNIVNQSYFCIEYSYAPYNEDGSLGSWSTLTRTQDGGATAIMSREESLCFLPDKEYAVKVKLSIVNRNDRTIKYWPFDDTPEEDYLIEFSIGKTEIYSDYTADSPKVIRAGADPIQLVILEENVVGFSAERISEWLRIIIQKKDVNGNWVNANSDDISIQSPNYSGGLVMNGVKGQNKGEYRILFTLENVPHYIPNGSTPVERARINCNLYDEATGKGIIYLNVID